MIHESKNDIGYKIKQWVWITSSISIALLLALIIIVFVLFNNLSLKISQDILPAHDTVYVDKYIKNEADIPLFENKRIEDSLQVRIVKVLDSLSILEDKLKFMQSNSSSSIDLIISIADSIEFYRRETVNLKGQIEKINGKTEKLLRLEREKNEGLKKRLEYYEKRLSALYAINLEVLMFSDGYDQNNKLVTTNKAKKIQEITISFILSREIGDEEEVNVEITRGTEKIFIFNDVKAPNRQVNRRFRVTSVTKLNSGKYAITVYHNYKKYDISHTIIGQSIITLE